jgi:hypothetical protein
MSSAGNMEGVSAAGGGISASTASGDGGRRGKNCTPQEQLSPIVAYVKIEFDSAVGDQQRLEVFSS